MNQRRKTMKETVRKKIALVLMGVATLGLVACGSVEKKTGIETSGNDVMKMSGEKSQIHLTQTKETDAGFEVPDPKKTDGTVEVVIHKCQYAEETDATFCTEKKDEPTYDLSYLGFKDKVYITNAAVGNISGEGECLVLVIDENKNVDINENYAYIAVLDYKNKKSYLTRTDIFAGLGGRDEQLNLWDVTGDGKDEVILSSEPNMHIDWNLYEFTGKELKRIYSNVETAELERDAFRVELLDDYKMKITGVKCNYEQTISLLDLGCQKSELEYVDPNELDRSDNQAARVYKDGKLGMTEEDTAGALSLHALMAETWDNHYAEYDYFKERNDDKTIRTSLGITIGSKEIGKLNVYLKYDAETDSLVISRAEFVGEK